MSTKRLIYNGRLASGQITIAGQDYAFKRGEAVEVPAAAALGPDWSEAATVAPASDPSPKTSKRPRSAE